MHKEENTFSSTALTAEQVKPFFKTLVKVQLRDRENYDGKNSTTGLLVDVTDTTITLEHRDGLKSLILLSAITKITQLPAPAKRSQP